jgi:hypothetical protein
MATAVLWLCLLPLVACSALEDVAKASAPNSGKFSSPKILKANYLSTVQSLYRT